MICMSRASARSSSLVARVTSLPFEPDLARGRLEQAQDAAPGCALAASRFADEAERLAGHQIEADAADRMDVLDLAAEPAAGDREALDQVLDPQQRRVHAATFSPLGRMSKMQRTL
jgi:hypothetical protein